MNNNIKMYYIKRSFIRKIIDSLQEPIRIYNLYKDKPLLYRLEMVFYGSSIFDPISDIYIKILSFFNNIKRVIQFLPYVWRHRDWDCDFIFIFSYYLYKRLYVEISKNLGKYKRSSSRIKAVKRLKTVMLLYKRLYENRYDEYIVKEIKNRFGEEYITSPFVEKVQKNKKYYEFLNKHYNFTENRKNQDLNLAHKLIFKYHNHWWD